MKLRNFSQNLSTFNFSIVYGNIWLESTIIIFVIKKYLNIRSRGFDRA